MADINFDFDINAKSAGVDEAAGDLGKMLDTIVATDKEWSKFEAHIKSGGAKGAPLKQLEQQAYTLGQQVGTRLREKGVVFGATVDKMAASSRKAADAHAQHAAGFVGIGSAVDAVHHKVHDFLSFTGALLAFEALKKIGSEVKHLAGEMIHAAESNEKIKLSLELLTSREEAEELLGWVAKIGDKTQFTQQQLEEWSIELLKAGVPLKNIDKFIAAGGDLAARSAHPLEAMSTAMQVLGRAQLKGFVSGKDLLGLGIGERQLRALPQFAGLTAKEIQKKLSEGTFKIADVFKIIAGPDKRLGTEMLRAGELLESKFIHLHERGELFFQNLLDTPGYAKFKEGIGDLITNLDPESPDGRRIFNSLARQFELLGGIASSIDLAGMIAFATEQLEKLELGFLTVLAAFGNEKAEKLIGQMGFRKRLDADTERGRQLNEQVDSTVKGNKLFDEFDEPLVYGPGFQTGETYGEGVEQGTRKALGTHSPSTVFQDIGADVAAGFALGLGAPVGDNVARGAFALPVPQGGRAGVAGASISIDMGGITIQGGTAGADPRAHADAIMAELRQRLPAELATIWDQLVLEEGA